jgi:hypothetical protein
MRAIAENDFHSAALLKTAMFILLIGGILASADFDGAFARKSGVTSLNTINKDLILPVQSSDGAPAKTHELKKPNQQFAD